MILVEPYQGRAVSKQAVEVVERKGIGHPDSMCDAIMEAISVALSQAYQAEFGAVLHHNIDKSLLAAGRVERRFGGGRVVKPMELTIGDRATATFRGKTLPVGEIAVAAAKEWLKGHMRFVDPDKHVAYRLVLGPGSEALSDIFSRPGRVRVANDTSAVVGYYPLSPTEKAVLGLEHHLNSPSFKRRFPESGEDVKVMGFRCHRTLEVTVAMPLLCSHIASEKAYWEKKEAIRGEISAFLGRIGAFEKCVLHLNALDAKDRGQAGIYLSLLGTSAEDADSGQVGRGNRVNGLISINRPMGTEAAAGKNALSHVGKIYNVLAYRLARQIYEQVQGIEEIYLLLLSRIGYPVDRPVAVCVQILPREKGIVEELRPQVKRIIAQELCRMEDFCRRLAKGEFPVC